MVDTSRFNGVVEVIFWYMNGIPVGALTKGDSVDKDETAFSGEPLTPISVPRRV